MEALRRTQRHAARRYFMEERNVFRADETGDVEATEYPIEAPND